MNTIPPSVSLGSIIESLPELAAHHARTSTTYHTLDESARSTFDTTRQFMASSKGCGASLETVAECIDWCLSAPRSAVGGRNFSLVHDQWRQPQFIEELIANPDSYKLRRFS